MLYENNNDSECLWMTCLWWGQIVYRKENRNVFMYTFKHAHRYMHPHRPTHTHTHVSSHTRVWAHTYVNTHTHTPATCTFLLHIRTCSISVCATSIANGSRSHITHFCWWKGFEKIIHTLFFCHIYLLLLFCSVCVLLTKRLSVVVYWTPALLNMLAALCCVCCMKITALAVECGDVVYDHSHSDWHTHP